MLKISLNRLSTKGLGDLAQRVCNLIKALLQGIFKDNPVAATLLQKNEMYQEIVIRKTFSGKGRDLAKQDALRDKLYRSLRRLLRTLAALPDAARKEATEELLQAFDLAGSIKGLDYGSQNTVMRKLLQLLSSDENKARIATLGLTGDFAAFEKSQTDFEALADLQTDENSALRQMQTASGIRHELEDALRGFFALVSAMKNVPVWDDLYYDVKEVIKEIHPRPAKAKDNESGEEDAADNADEVTQ